MKYVEKINKLAEILMELEEDGTSGQVILDAELAYDLAIELRDKFDKPFLIEYDDQFEIDLKENDILGVAVNVYDDGEVEYFLQPVLSEEGETWKDEASEVILIQDDLMDCIEVDKFEGRVLSFTEETEQECNGDCENCKVNEDNFEEEDLSEVLADEMLTSIAEFALEDRELAYQIICEKIEEAYQIGREDFRDELQESLCNL